MEFVKDYLSDERRQEIEAMKIRNPLAKVTYDNIDFKVIKSIDEYYVLIKLNGYGNYFREFGVHERDNSIYAYYAFVYGDTLMYYNILTKNIKTNEKLIGRKVYSRNEFKLEKIKNFKEEVALCKAIHLSNEFKNFIASSKVSNQLTSLIFIIKTP
ncbi:MAG: hypothetical protein K6G26_13020 [Lachnospiraceae bacterium]|nr:hypothetical protein [Lachnospiraceae bacterium]